MQSLKIGTSLGMAETITNHLHEFLQNEPMLDIHLVSTPNIYEIKLGEVDAVISTTRYFDPNIIQHFLYDSKARIMASEGYFESHPRPNSLEDLKDHRLLSCVSKENELREINNHSNLEGRTTSMISFNNERFLRNAISGDLGIGFCSYCSDFPETYDFVDVFPQMEDHITPYYFSYHKRLEGLPAIKALLEFMKEVVKVWSGPQKEEGKEKENI